VVQIANLSFLWIKFKFDRMKSATRFLCVKTSSCKVAEKPFSYLTVYIHLFIQKEIRCEIQFCACGIYRLTKMCGRMRIHEDRWAMNAWVDGGYPYGCEDGWGMDGEWGINSKVSK